MHPVWHRHQRRLPFIIPWLFGTAAAAPTPIDHTAAGRQGPRTAGLSGAADRAAAASQAAAARSFETIGDRAAQNLDIAYIQCASPPARLRAVNRAYQLRAEPAAWHKPQQVRQPGYLTRWAARSGV